MLYIQQSTLYKCKPLVNNTTSTTEAPAGVVDPPLNYVDLQRDSLGYAIKRAQIRTYEVLFRVLGPDSLTPGRMTALSIIATQSGINQTVLAEMLGITRAGVVKVIDSLEALGYVERQPIPEDRRSHSLVVTEPGYLELSRLNTLMRRHEKMIASKLSRGERALLMQLLEKVASD